jgi:hypothetical protein
MMGTFVPWLIINRTRRGLHRFGSFFFRERDEARVSLSRKQNMYKSCKAKAA